MDLKNYDVIEKIGEGGFGQVWLLEAKINIPVSKDKENIVAKEINFDKLSDNSKKDILFETKLCTELNHPNITKCFGSSRKDAYLYIFMEYANGGDLFKYIQDKERLREYETKPIIKDILAALEYCHSKKICHHDLKPENILIFEDGVKTIYKITDWGLADNISEELKRDKGSIDYASPEILQKTGHYCDKSDMWAVGVIAYTCIEGYYPHKGKNKQQIKNSIIEGKPTFKHSRQDAEDFISNLLQKDPNKRMSAKEALNHKWLKS